MCRCERRDERHEEMLLIVLTIQAERICLNLIAWLLLVPQTGLCVTSAPF